MKMRAGAALGLPLLTGLLVLALALALVPVGCNPEGVGTVGPPPGTKRDDNFLIPGYDPAAAKALKKKKSRAAPPKGEAVETGNARH